MQRRLTADVSVSEMLRMREEGMSNKAIGDALGVSSQTIYRHIGPQGPEIRRQPVYGGKPKPYHEPEVEKKEEYPACLVVVNRAISLKGTVCHYEIDPKSKLLKIIMEDGANMKLDFEKFGTFVEELEAIKRNISTLKIENEMW